MQRQHRKGLVLAVLAASVIGLASSQCFALYDFQFTTLDYAIETPYWGVAIFKTICENTGTQGDSIRFSIATNTPPGWFCDYCLEGRCYFANASVWFDAGEIDTIDVEVFVDDVSAMGTLTLTGTMKSAPAVTHSETYGCWNQLPSVLIVDDDAGQNYQTYLANALTAAGYPGRVYNANASGRPSSILLNSHWMVFWTTAGGDASYLTSTDEANLASFLDGRGKLFLASAGFLSSRGSASSFVTDYLEISSWTNDTGGNPVNGVAGDPISSGMSLDLSGGPVPLTASDSFVRHNPADTIFTSGTGVKGLRIYTDTYRAVFLAFPFENVSTVAANPNNQNTLIARVMDWFDPPLAGFPEADPSGTGLVIRPAGLNPFSASAEVFFAVAGGGEDVTVAVYDVMGRVVRTLFSGPVGSAGALARWDGSDETGTAVAPGVYLCSIRAASGLELSTKLVLTK